MVDPRVKKLADILVNYSIKVKKGSIIRISFGILAKSLALECYKLILKKGAFAIINPVIPDFSYNYYKLASNEQLNKFPKIAKFEAENIDGLISIGAEYNTKEFSNIDSKKMGLRSKVTNPISKIYSKKNNWVYCEYPTHALSQEAEMNLEELKDIVFKSTNLDWKKESLKQDKLKKILDKANKIRIITKSADVSFSVKGRRAVKSDGHRNMPGGEVFIAPVKDTVEGHIKFSLPAIYRGQEMKGIKLEFKDGKVIKSSADKGEQVLKEIIKTDKGSKYIGEFGIGLNYGIKKFLKHTLFDEKKGGTIHLALGSAYKEGGGKNESAVHMDLITDMKKGGRLYVDGKLIQKDGKFLFKL